MRKLLLPALTALALTGCAGAQKAIVTVDTLYTKVQAYYSAAPRTVFALRGGYDIALGAAVAFKTSTCPSVTSYAFCAKAIPALRDANHKALIALDDAEAFVRTNPSLDASALISAAQQAILTFAKIESDNGVSAQ